MYTTASRRVCSALLRPTIRPSTLLSPATLSNTRPRASLPIPTTSYLPRLHLRSFARRLYDEPDDIEPVLEEEDEIGMKPEEELEEEEERRAARGPSKAERLRLKEKEKRRQKLAMRERVDNKKEKKGQDGLRGRRGRVVEDDFDEDDAVDLFDVLDDDNDGRIDIDLTPTAVTQPVEQQADALIADRQRQKKEMLRQRFERQEAEEDEDEGEDEEDKEAERPVNDAIIAPAIVLIDGAGKRIGLVSTPVALKKARDSQLDIVTLSPPHVTPPICRVVDYADWLLMERQRKGLDEPSKRSKTLQIRKLIDKHDLEVKAAAARRFLQRGHQVRVQYFEKSIAEGEWVELFERLAALVEGVGVSQDLVSKPIAVFEPVRKKKQGEEGRQGKKEMVKKESQQLQTQKQQQLPAGAVQEDSSEATPATSESGRGDAKQHAKAGR